jgi:hypothetical protein
MILPADKDGWPKLVRDLRGLRVRTTKPLSNGFMTVPKGTPGVITAASAWERISFRGDPCSCCGVTPLIGQVGKSDLEVVPTGGYGTDVRAGDAACRRWEKPGETPAGG